MAATLTTIVVFFPVTFLFGVSRFLFGALAIAVVLALVASYVVALGGAAVLCRVSSAPYRHDSVGPAMSPRDPAPVRADPAERLSSLRTGGRFTLSRPLAFTGRAFALFFAASLPLYRNSGWRSFPAPTRASS